MSKVKVGVFGGGRGTSMVNQLARHPDAELVAICDANPAILNNCRQVAESAGSQVRLYSDFEEFLQDDMEAVVLANYATEHAPFAVRLLDSGRHVCSEVLACQTLAEAVALVEAVERSGKVYSYAENYCYFRGTLEMKRLYQQGDIGEFLHGEGEYVHDCGPAWVPLTRGEREHWRNWIPATFYCTHSTGPLLTITGTRPTRVTAYETPNLNCQKFGRRGADGAVILCQMSNGATAKFLPWSNFKREPGAIWYSVYGSKGMMETNRWAGGTDQLNVYLEGEEQRCYTPDFPLAEKLAAAGGGHGGSDFYTMHYFLEAILGRPDGAESIDVYQGLDMTLPGILGYRSIWESNAALEVPDLRDASLRDKYRNDHWCVAPKLAGPGQPEWSNHWGPIEPEDALYEEQRRAWRKLIGEEEA